MTLVKRLAIGFILLIALNGGLIVYGKYRFSQQNVELEQAFACSDKVYRWRMEESFITKPEGRRREAQTVLLLCDSGKKALRYSTLSDQPIVPFFARLQWEGGHASLKSYLLGLVEAGSKEGASFETLQAVRFRAYALLSRVPDHFEGEQRVGTTHGIRWEVDVDAKGYPIRFRTLDPLREGESFGSHALWVLEAARRSSVTGMPEIIEEWWQTRAGKQNICSRRVVAIDEH